MTEEERLAEKQVIIQTRERELKCALEEVLAARQEVQAKTAQVKQYKKQVDSLKAQVRYSIICLVTPIGFLYFL